MNGKAGSRTGLETIRRWVRDERGATSIEYAMIAVGIAAAVAATVMGAGQSLKTNFYEKINAATAN